MIFVNSNSNILQSTQWKFLKFFSHLLKLVHYKILQFYVSKNVFFFKNLILVLEMEVLEHFWWNIVEELKGLKVKPWRSPIGAHCLRGVQPKSNMGNYSMAKLFKFYILIYTSKPLVYEYIISYKFIIFDVSQCCYQKIESKSFWRVRNNLDEKSS